MNAERLARILRPMLERAARDTTPESERLNALSQLHKALEANGKSFTDLTLGGGVFPPDFHVPYPEWQRRVKERDEQLKERDAEIKQLRKELAALERRKRSGWDAELKELRKTVAGWEKSVAQLETALEAKSKLVANMIRDYDALETQADELRAEVAALRSEVEAASTFKAALSAFLGGSFEGAKAATDPAASEVKQTAQAASDPAVDDVKTRANVGGQSDAQAAPKAPRRKAEPRPDKAEPRPCKRRVRPRPAGTAKVVWTFALQDVVGELRRRGLSYGKIAAELNARHERGAFPFEVTASSVQGQQRELDTRAAILALYDLGCTDPAEIFARLPERVPPSYAGVKLKNVNEVLAHFRRRHARAA